MTYHNDIGVTLRYNIPIDRKTDHQKAPKNSSALAPVRAQPGPVRRYAVPEGADWNTDHYYTDHA